MSSAGRPSFTVSPDRVGAIVGAVMGSKLGSLGAGVGACLGFVVGEIIGNQIQEGNVVKTEPHSRDEHEAMPIPPIMDNEATSKPKKLMFCPHCGKDNSQGSLLCMYCGSRLPDEQESDQ